MTITERERALAAETRKRDVDFMAASVGITIRSGGDEGPWARIVPCDLADEVADRIDELDPNPSFLKTQGATWLRIHTHYFEGCTHGAGPLPKIEAPTAVEDISGNLNRLAQYVHEEIGNQPNISLDISMTGKGELVDALELALARAKIDAVTRTARMRTIELDSPEMEAVRQLAVEVQQLLDEMLSYPHETALGFEVETKNTSNALAEVRRVLSIEKE